MARNPLNFQIFGGIIDEAISRAGEMRGPKFRIITANGGYQIQEQVLTVSGTWKWQDDFFTTNKARAEEKLAARLRG